MASTARPTATPAARKAGGGAPDRVPRRDNRALPLDMRPPRGSGPSCNGPPPESRLPVTYIPPLTVDDRPTCPGVRRSPAAPALDWEFCSLFLKAWQADIGLRASVMSHPASGP